MPNRPDPIEQARLRKAIEQVRPALVPQTNAPRPHPQHATNAPPPMMTMQPNPGAVLILHLAESETREMDGQITEIHASAVTFAPGGWIVIGNGFLKSAFEMIAPEKVLIPFAHPAQIEAIPPQEFSSIQTDAAQPWMALDYDKAKQVADLGKAREITSQEEADALIAEFVEELQKAQSPSSTPSPSPNGETSS